MKLVRQPGEAGFEKRTVATVGTFDGVHRAHRRILEQVVQRARAIGGRSLVVTFEPHPREVVGPDPEAVRILTTLSERTEQLESLGVDVLLVLTFDRSFSRQSPREFYAKYLVEGTGLSAVFEGFDHHWGRDREGNIQQLQALGREFGFDVVAVDPVMLDGRVVNSSTVRADLTAGLVEAATGLLGRPYSLTGRVILGDQRGRLLGYPTANLELESPKKLLPKDGIYVVRVDRGDRSYGGMLSIGVRPTFHSNGVRTVEVHILDFQDDIYGETIRVSLLRRLRDELRFGSAEDLIRRMQEDEKESRARLREYEKTLTNTVR